MITVFLQNCPQFEGVDLVSRVRREELTRLTTLVRVHPAPGAHISMAGCTILGGVHPVCARFLSYLSLLCCSKNKSEKSQFLIYITFYTMNSKNDCDIIDIIGYP